MNTFFDRRWRQSLLEALFITSVVLGLFIYWFGCGLCGGNVAGLGHCASAWRLGRHASVGSALAAGGWLRAAAGAVVAPRHELPGRGLSLSPPTAWAIALGGSLAGLLWLVGISLLRRWWHKAIPSAGALFMAGLGLNYVLLPLVHYRLATPPDYHYISAASNFFAFTWEVQAVVLLVAIGLALGVTDGRRRLIR